MPQQRSTTSNSSRASAGSGNRAAASTNGDSVDATPALRDYADAMCRAATESARQHERLAVLTSGEPMPQELRALHDVVTRCDEALAEMTALYEKSAANAHPTGDDESWWHRANGLWHASREYARRCSVTVRASRSLVDHSAAKFGELQLEYELEASALLGLRHAVDAYAKVRNLPGLAREQ